ESDILRLWFIARLLLAWSFFQQALLEFLLALDAVARPGHSLKALGVDFFTAVDALAKTSLPDARQRFLHHLQELPLVIALAEQKLLRVGTGGAVGNVLGGVLVGGAAVCLGTGDRSAQILLPRLQPLLECF